MKIVDILRFMGEQGAHFKESELPEAIAYFEKMIAAERFILISDSNGIAGFITFSICDDYDLFYKKKTWDYLPDDFYGKTVYIEIMVCKKWTRSLRESFEREILEKYPYLSHGIWHRETKTVDRKVIARRSNVQITNSFF